MNERLGQKEEAYKLHAICVHDGSAEGGHFFTFIKDHRHNKWRKFNDMRITEVDESEVLTQANGGHGAMTAFWVIYLSKTQI